LLVFFEEEQSKNYRKQQKCEAKTYDNGKK